MAEKNENNKWIMYVRWFVLRFVLVLFDILAVNAAYYFALVIRFYVANEFHSLAGKYLIAYYQFAPYYTVCCLLVFAAFKLYSGMWKYAGINDMNRIVLANIVCTVVQIAGSCLFVCRMPITYYFIGAVVQFCLVAASRLSYRMVTVEINKMLRGRNRASVNAMVIGSGETARTVLKQLERANIAKPVCVVSYRSKAIGSMLDGIPVVNGLEYFPNAVKKYQVNLVIIADSLMPQEVRNQIKQTCKEADLEAQDFSGYFHTGRQGISLKNLAECSTGAVELVIDEKHMKFADGEQALMNVVGNYDVKAVSAKGNTLVIELTGHTVIQNDLNAEWVKQQEKETGEEISFF